MLIELLFAALHARIGVIVEPVDCEPKRLREKLYEAKRGNPEFENLALTIVEGNVWIAKKYLEASDAEA